MLHNKFMKLWKKFIILTLFVITIGVLCFNAYCATVISELNVNNETLQNIKTDTIQTSFYDTNNNIISQNNLNGNSYIEIEKLKDYTKNAFIAIEDQNFYNHNGLNLKRIVKAGFNNVISGYAKEGASTITQQLIKNALLTNEKSIKRKIQEAYLANKIENILSKEEILEAYLNLIYFGNGAYGIESASQIFFDCSASELTIAESATLAGIIKSPHYYSPIDNPSNCIERRNLVLKEMFNEKYISEEEYNYAKNTELNIKENNTFFSNLLYLKYALNQAKQILNISEKDIANGNYKIFTNLNTDMQEKLYNDYLILNSKLKNKNIKDALIVVNNNTNSVLSLLSNNTTFLPKRQPGSLIKPLLCYAPAFEEGILSPATPILDNKIKFNSYSPENVDNKYDGWISTRLALAKSKNIPAVKVLEYVGIEKAKNYVNKLGINFDSSDNHLALALGGMKYGTTPLEITNAYNTLANYGQYSQLNFVNKIVDKNDKVVYILKKENNQVFSSETAYLINDVLLDTKVVGTAKKLSNFKNWAIKTGTSGAEDGSNTDAWCVSYSNDYTVCAWIGNTSGDSNNNLTKSQNGGSLGANYCKIAMSILPAQAEFEQPANIETINLDNIELSNNQKLLLASPNLPERYIIQEKFNKKYAPTKTSKNYKDLTPTTLSGKIDGEKVKLEWKTKPLITYELYGKNSRIEQKIASFNEDTSNFEYVNTPKFDTFYIVSKYENSDLSVKSNELKFYLSKTDKKQGLKQIVKHWFY